jgi:hypothetical protein
MICPAIDNLVSCEIRDVICFLHAINMSASEINRELCAVYGQNVMMFSVIYIYIYIYSIE